MRQKSKSRKHISTTRNTGDNSENSATPNLFVRLLDPLVILLVKLIIGLGEIKSRDPREDPHRALRPDHQIQSKLKTWRAILDWPPGRRVGWFVGIVLGIAAGGAFLWYMLRE